MDEKIILIVGDSGAGKDTLLKALRNEFSNINFVRRYITREADSHENNYFLETSAFTVLQTQGFFISSWYAHGNSYGISRSSIKKGVNIISISRSRIKDFESSYEKVFTINITVSKEVLRKRLEKRARESKEEIDKRLERNYPKLECKKLINFDNSLPLEQSIEKFKELIKSLCEI
ncbi:AAA family ATPase [Halarcobacter sp.]|uniref:AAA family ATPase n=1 Tax=Halarcobacter sp. TaxID=2321133 RepID=UPI003A95899C